MITEKEVAAIIEMLPQDSFLKNYVNYARGQTASHASFHVAIGLSLIAAVAPKGLMAKGFKKDTYPNFYAVVVGPSGEAEKTLAIDVAKELLAEAVPGREGSDPTAEETLTKILGNRPQLLFIYTEMGSFLAKTGGRDTRGQAIRAGFTDYFDGLSRTREYSKGPLITVNDPRPSFLGACTPRHLEEHTTSLDWEGGFLSRFFVAYGTKEHDRGAPNNDPDMRAYLLDWLRWSASEEGLNHLKPCLGMSTAALARWSRWKSERTTRYAEQMKNERVRGIISRSELLAAKCTLLVTQSCITRTHQPWRIDLDAVEAGVALADLHLKSALALVERIAPNLEMREQQDVYAAVGDDWTPLGDVLKNSNLTNKRAAPYIETLLLHNSITTSLQDVTAYYRKVPGGTPRPYDAGMEGSGTPPPPPPPVVMVEPLVVEPLVATPVVVEPVTATPAVAEALTEPSAGGIVEEEGPLEPVWDNTTGDWAWIKR